MDTLNGSAGAPAQQDGGMERRSTRANNGSVPQNATNEVNGQENSNSSTSNPGNGTKAPKRQTVAGLAIIVDSIQENVQENASRAQTLDARVEGIDTEMKRSNAAMEAKLDRLCRLVSSSHGNDAANNSNVPVSQSVSVNRNHRPLTPQDTIPVNLGSPGASAMPGGAGTLHQTATRRHGGLSTLPPPATIVREENRLGQIDRLISKEDYRPSSIQQGKPHHYDIGMVKPYYYIEREGVQTTRQKLDLRANMSALEYINCTHLLLRDYDAFDIADKEDIFNHLTAVTTDALARPWPAVRRWSQFIWDSVEKGRCEWNSYQYIQEQRVRICYMSSQSANLPGANNGSRQATITPSTAQITVLCRDYNGPSGCRFTTGHEDGVVKYMHACAHCDSMGRRSAHSFQRCRSRADMPQGAPPSVQSDNRQWGNQQQRHQQPGPYGQAQAQPGTGNRQNSYHSNTGPKNG